MIRCRALGIRGATLLLVLSATAGHALGIPPPPAAEQYILDTAGLLSSADAMTIAALQHDALERFNTPIVVVTIARARDYGGDNDVDALAKRWFNTWQIGTLGLKQGANQGVLLLVSLQDRRARIELGGDWGHNMDARCQSIMQNTLVPAFKRGDYSGGIVTGVELLSRMATAGPFSHPPGDFLEDRVRPLTAYSFLDPKPFLIAIGIGVLFIIAGIWSPRYKTQLILTGIAIILVTALTWMVLAVVAMLASSARRSSGSGGFSSRGMSGGSSGGGGASGSW